MQDLVGMLAGEAGTHCVLEIRVASNKTSVSSETVSITRANLQPITNFQLNHYYAQHPKLVTPDLMMGEVDNTTRLRRESLCVV